MSKAQKDLEAGPAGPCLDENELCAGWAEKGECEKNPTYMAVSCRAACKLCKKVQEAPGKQAPGNKTAQGDQAIVTSSSHSGLALHLKDLMYSHINPSFHSSILCQQRLLRV